MTPLQMADPLQLPAFGTSGKGLVHTEKFRIKMGARGPEMPIAQTKPDVNEALSSLGLLQAGHASVTAMRVAMKRAAHQVLDHPRIFEDMFALAIVGADPAGLQSPEKPGGIDSKFIRAFMASRSRFAEDQLARSVEGGCAQYVVLGAGLDTFGYRNPFESAGLTVFEVDHPATQSWKRERLLSARIPIPASVHFASVDFERESLRDGLRRTTFDFDKPAFFSWLGVTPYLSLEAFDQTLEFVGSLAQGTALTFDYAVSPTALSPMERLAFDILRQRVADVGEDFRLFFEPDEVAEHLRKRHFDHVSQLDSAEINARYFTGRGDGLQVIGNFARLVHAIV